MTMIEYDETDYKILETQEMDKELGFKLVKFNTGFYGVITYNPTTMDEVVTLVSPEKDEDNEFHRIFGGLGCKSFIVFARDAKNYLENSPIELVVKLGQDAPEEYRETITRDQSKTLYEKVEICHEIMQMKLENSFHYKYGDYVLTGLTCLNVLLFVLVAVNSLNVLGGI